MSDSEFRAPRAGKFQGTDIRDLGVIGDQRTAAIVSRDGSILWYCPDRFDRPSLFAGLLDAAAGEWGLDTLDATPLQRNYIADSGVLETHLCIGGNAWTITDWMSLGGDAPRGMICRRFTAPSHDVRVFVAPRPDFASAVPNMVELDRTVVIDGGAQYLYGSHKLVVRGYKVSMTLPEGQPGWMILSDQKLDRDSLNDDIQRWLRTTLEHWCGLAQLVSYSGPYQREVANSLRAIRLLRHDESGGIVAAATTSLPEIPGGPKNWDYRYVWLRDAGMIVSALTRIGGDLSDAERYLDFMCRSRGSSPKYPMAVFTTLDGTAAPGERILEFAGYQQSRPVKVGNDAGDQLQLDGFANVLLAAKLLYQRIDQRPHWDAVQEISEFLVQNWREPDHGIWEERGRLQYTASKVIVACGLASVAEFSADPNEADRWLATVDEIRDFVASECLTEEGAYAAVAGGRAVDVSAALFPAWGFVDASAPEMKATVAALERNHSFDELLYWRHLQYGDARSEGAFLAGGFWIAQYWAIRGEIDKAVKILDAGLAYANDLGFFAEEAEPRGGNKTMLGNIPQSFVHAAFIGAVIDLRHAIASGKSTKNNTGKEMQ